LCSLDELEEEEQSGSYSQGTRFTSPFSRAFCRERTKKS
jgi:hypothetical protein